MKNRLLNIHVIISLSNFSIPLSDIPKPVSQMPYPSVLCWCGCPEYPVQERCSQGFPFAHKKYHIPVRREWQLQRSNTTRQILKNFTIIDRCFLFMNAKLEKFCQSCLNFQFEFVNNHIFGVEIWFAIRIVIRG